MDQQVQQDLKVFKEFKVSKVYLDQQDHKEFKVKLEI